MANYPHIPAPLTLNDCVKGFVYHYNIISTWTRIGEIEGDLASFCLRKVLDEIRGYKDLHLTKWDVFLDCIEENVSHFQVFLPQALFLG
jgi:hypothetical protein